MGMEYDPKKSVRNFEQRGFGFDLVHQFDWTTSVSFPDSRFDYGEERVIEIGFIRNRLHVLVWTERNGKRRVISLRKANAREQRQYEEEKTADK